MRVEVRLTRHRTRDAHEVFTDKANAGRVGRSKAKRPTSSAAAFLGALIWQQAEDIELRLRTDIHLSVCDGRNSELYCYSRFVAVVEGLGAIPKLGLQVSWVVGMEYSDRGGSSFDSPENCIVGPNCRKSRGCPREAKRLDRH